MAGRFIGNDDHQAANGLSICRPSRNRDGRVRCRNSRARISRRLDAGLLCHGGDPGARPRTQLHESRAREDQSNRSTRQMPSMRIDRYETPNGPFVPDHQGPSARLRTGLIQWPKTLTRPAAEQLANVSNAPEARDIRKRKTQESSAMSLGITSQRRTLGSKSMQSASTRSRSASGTIRRTATPVRRPFRHPRERATGRASAPGTPATSAPSHRPIFSDGWPSASSRSR